MTTTDTPPAEETAGGNGRDLERIHGAVFMITGAALVAHILLPIPLPIALVITIGLAWLLVWAFARTPMRIAGYASSRLVRVGLITSVFAVAAYDLSRLALAEVADFSLGPFDAFPHFGSALIGESRPEGLRLVVGTIFHYVNGITFSVAFVIIFRDRGVWWGIAWGLALEAAMLGVYPSFLQIEQLREFVELSVFGHICYGAVLGSLSRRLLHRGAVVTAS